MSERVWSTFQAMRSDGLLVRLSIQDLPKTRIDDGVQLFVDNFFSEETFLVAAGISRNPEAIAELKTLVTESLKDPACHSVICCEKRVDGKVGRIIGVSSMILVTEVRPDNMQDMKRKTKELQTLSQLMEDASLLNIMKKLNISHFYEGFGAVVHPEFRRLGIMTEFLKARCLACVAHNVPATGALMTCIASQKAAEKENWETVLNVDLQELGRKYGVIFDNKIYLKPIRDLFSYVCVDRFLDL
ncbi:uncharacterized protein LOC125233509 [Leguminivora glycinivorella]|uniref:uncharacterized protein LOC125233509 n=1 Tax=Leguminivora glycinivorella TaxID=1035111 RepID=UPI00200F28FA|nr:uncharacterized protein LOC125233509 [Leguminivora glycinivorella]